MITITLGRNRRWKNQLNLNVCYSDSLLGKLEIGFCQCSKLLQLLEFLDKRSFWSFRCPVLSYLRSKAVCYSRETGKETAD